METTTVLDMTMEPATARRLHTLSKRIDNTVEKRDREIVRAHLEGAALREIARAVGMSHVGVRDIVRRRQPDFFIVHPDGTYIEVELKQHPRQEDDA